jgi:hypothetical protein
MKKYEALQLVITLVSQQDVVTSSPAGGVYEGVNDLLNGSDWF